MRRILLVTAVVLFAAAAAMAQVTTSALRGTVKDQKGEPVVGASVLATYTPTGTVYGTMTGADGQFTIPSMRTGGPYTIKFTSVGFAEQVENDIYLKLGETYVVTPVMKEEGVQLDEVVVTANADPLMNSTRTGAVTNVGARQILSLPTISRSINDMTRLTPQASSSNSGAIGGGNYRQNYITVDGSDFNNTFGIGTNLPAGGSPISLDALEEISVNVTPYDIRQSGFIGSAINAVTRSGTNEFSGSAYTFWRNQNQQGHKVGNNEAFERQPLTDKTYGVRLGGPIIKNKLFFFGNFEIGERTSPGQTNFAATSAVPGDPGSFGSDPSISRPLASELDEISDFLRDEYGYETGPYQRYDFVSENTRFVLRLDWNINENHRFNVRYSQVESKSPSFVSTSRSPLTGYASTTGRTSNTALWFKNSNYYQEANFYSWAAELNSSLFGGKFSNTLRGTFTHQNDPRSSDSQVFPFVDILDGTGGSPGVPFTSFGYEPFSYGNLRDVKSYSFVDNLSWSTGNHLFTVGVQADFQTTKNGFQRFGTGYYTFASWDDFENGANPRDYAITYSLLPDYKQAYPRFKFAQYSVYGQDEYNVTDRLKLTFGLRLDLPTYMDVSEIKTHPMVAELEFADDEKIDTGVLPDTKVMFSPRVAFNWDVKGDRSLQVRGGSGVFTGRVPTVWIVAQSGDAGLLQFTQTYVGQANTPGPFQIDPYLPATQPEAGTQIPSTISATDPDFKFPQTWKSSLAVDVKLPWNIIGTVEGIYNKDLNIAKGRNPNLVDPTRLDIVDGGGESAYPDHRPIYPNAVFDKFINPLTAANSATPNQPVANGDATGTQALNPVVLDNASKGYYFSVTAKLEKQFSNGFSAYVAYTKSQAKVLYDGSGDQLLNTWSLTQIVNNANNPELSYANYVVPDRVVAAITYRKEYLKKLATSISLFYEGSITGRFSYTYSADFNRDGQTNDLIYVPKDPSEITFQDQTYNGVTYTAAQQSAMFFKYIEQDDYLSSRRGKYAERNGAKMPWRSQFDLRIAQDIFTNIGGKKNSLQFTIDIFNFGNFLSKQWGTFKTVNASAILQPRNVGSLVANGTVLPTFSLANDRGTPVTSTFRDNNTITSTYYMQFGLRYTFN